MPIECHMNGGGDGSHFRKQWARHGESGFLALVGGSALDQALHRSHGAATRPSLAGWCAATYRALALRRCTAVSERAPLNPASAPRRSAPAEEKRTAPDFNPRFGCGVWCRRRRLAKIRFEQGQFQP